MLRVHRRLVFVAGLALLAPSHAAVDANTASPAQLEALPGIGPALAARIVEERRKGPYASPQALAERVRGVGEASVRRMVAGGLVVGGSRAAPSHEPEAARPGPEIIAGYPAIPAPASPSARPRAAQDGALPARTRAAQDRALPAGPRAARVRVRVAPAPRSPRHHP